MIRIERSVLEKYTNSSIVSPFELEPSLSEIFHENTKLSPLRLREYSDHIAALTSNAGVRAMLSQSYKVYSLMDQVELPAPPTDDPLARTVVERRSQRRFSGEAMGLDELSRLLYLGYGRTDDGFYRAVASGGALYPLELYVVALDVEGLEPGLYHYGVEHHRLDVVRHGDLRSAIAENVVCEGIDLEHAGAVVVISALFRRTTLKYQNRGYRMVLLEAGAVSQNLGLAATDLGLGCCQIGGFHDDLLSEILEIDGVREAPLVPIVFGRLHRPEPEAGDGEETGAEQG